MRRVSVSVPLSIIDIIFLVFSTFVSVWKKKILKKQESVFSFCLLGLSMAILKNKTKQKNKGQSSLLEISSIPAWYRLEI